MLLLCSFKLQNEDGFMKAETCCCYVRLINPLHAELNTICHLLVLLGAHHIIHVSGLRLNYIVCNEVVLD